MNEAAVLCSRSKRRGAAGGGTRPRTARRSTGRALASGLPPGARRSALTQHACLPACAGRATMCSAGARRLKAGGQQHQHGVATAAAVAPLTACVASVRCGAAPRCRCRRRRLCCSRRKRHRQGKAGRNTRLPGVCVRDPQHAQRLRCRQPAAAPRPAPYISLSRCGSSHPRAPSPPRVHGAPAAAAHRPFLRCGLRPGAGATSSVQLLPLAQPLAQLPPALPCPAHQRGCPQGPGPPAAPHCCLSRGTPLRPPSRPPAPASPSTRLGRPAHPLSNPSAAGWWLVRGGVAAEGGGGGVGGGDDSHDHGYGMAMMAGGNGR